MNYLTKKVVISPAAKIKNNRVKFTLRTKYIFIFFNYIAFV